MASVLPVLRDYAALAARIKAAAQPPLSWRVYGQQVTPDGAEGYDLLIVRVPAVRDQGRRGRRAGSAEMRENQGSGDLAASLSRRPSGLPTRRGLLNGGTHGDEPAGTEALTRFLEQRRYQCWPHIEFIITPCTNPWGYVHDRREGPGGVDLNRSFRRAGKATPEISLLKRALGGQSFDIFVDCHEDVDAPGLYVFAPATLGKAIVAAAGKLGPVHPGPDVDGEIPLKDGVVEFESERGRERRRTWHTWPLPLYIARYHQRAAPFMPAAGQDRSALDVATDAPPDAENTLPPDINQITSATVETPTCLPLDQRAAMHLAAIDATLATLHY